MITVSFLDLVDIIIIVNSILFVVFLLTVKTKKFATNLLFSIFILTQALDVGAGFNAKYIYPNFPGYGLIISNLIFIMYPALFLYVLSVLYSDFQLKKKHLVHLTPFLISNLILVPRFLILNQEEKLSLMNDALFFNLIEIKFLYIFITFVTLFYLGWTFYHLFRCKKIIRENYSNEANHSYKWVFQFIMFYTITVIIGLAKNLFMYLGLDAAFNVFMHIIPIFIFIYICWIVIKALHSPDLFKGVDSNVQLITAFPFFKRNDEKVAKQIAEANPRIKELESFMENNEPFLDPSLTVFELSKLIGWTSKDLSVLINRDLGQHFFDFINNYRINKAKMYLKDYDSREYNVSEILYKVGFNSKSSFNTAFKKHAKLTPTQFRKAHS